MINGQKTKFDEILLKLKILIEYIIVLHVYVCTFSVHFILIQSIEKNDYVKFIDLMQFSNFLMLFSKYTVQWRKIAKSAIAACVVKYCSYYIYVNLYIYNW